MDLKNINLDLKNITLETGPYGLYFQWNENDNKAIKPKRIGVPQKLNIKNINIKLALLLNKLPRNIGIHPIKKELISAGVSRFGPYLKMDNKFTSLKNMDSAITMTLEEAVVMLDQ